MRDDLIFGIITTAIVLGFVVFVAFILFHAPPTWTSDLTHATCESRRAGESYHCLQDGLVYLCVDDWSSHHRSCAQVAR